MHVKWLYSIIVYTTLIGRHEHDLNQLNSKIKVQIMNSNFKKHF